MLHLHDFTYGLATPALSYVVASIGALLGLRAVTRARASQGASRSRWLLLAGSAMGSIGIWAMGFAGLIGFAVGGETTRYEANVIEILMENLDRLWRGETELRNQVV